MKRPRLIYNDDGCSLMRIAPPHSLEAMYRSFDYLDHSQVDCISWNTAVGDVAYTYRSNVVDNLYDLYDLSTGTDAAMSPVNNLMFTLYKQGIDYLPFLIDDMHRRGIAFFASFRMNDAHLKSKPEGALASKFWKEHQEMRLWSVNLCRSYYNAAMDYSFPVIRERRLAMMQEVAERYDVDGIEVDFCRNPFVFQIGEAWQKRDVLTDFLCQIRDSLNRIAEKKKKALKIIMRVPFSEKRRYEAGMDLGAWLKQHLFDILVMSSHYNNYNIEFERILHACRENGLWFYPSIELNPMMNFYPFVELPEHVTAPRHYENVPENLEERLMHLRAIAQNYLAQQPDGVYMFNYPCSIFEAYPVEIFPNPMVDGELGQRAALLRQIASLETLERADKEYLYWHELPIYIEPMRPAKYYQTVDFYLNDAGIHAPQAAITLSFHQVGESNPHAYAKPSSPFIGKGYMTYVLNGRVLDEELIMKEKVAPGKICSGFTLGEHDRVIIPLDPAWLRQGMNRLEFEIRHRPRDCDYYVYIYQLSLQIRHH